jgi:hypothetical protein
MQDQVEKVRSSARGNAGVRWRARSVLLVFGLACVGLVYAQVPSGDPSPFIEAEIEMDTSVETPGGSVDVRGKININTDGLGEVIDAVIGALCRILPCGGADDDGDTQALLRTDAQTIGDERTGILVQGGAVGIGELFAGIVVEESDFRWGFNIRFADDAAVKIRSLTFTRDAFLTEAYLRQVGLDGAYYVAAGTYWVVDHKLTIPVRQRR